MVERHRQECMHHGVFTHCFSQWGVGLESVLTSIKQILYLTLTLDQNIELRMYIL